MGWPRPPGALERGPRGPRLSYTHVLAPRAAGIIFRAVRREAGANLSSAGQTVYTLTLVNDSGVDPAYVPTQAALGDIIAGGDDVVRPWHRSDARQAPYGRRRGLHLPPFFRDGPMFTVPRDVQDRSVVRDDLVGVSQPRDRSRSRTRLFRPRPCPRGDGWLVPAAQPPARAAPNPLGGKYRRLSMGAHRPTPRGGGGRNW